MRVPCGARVPRHIQEAKETADRLGSSSRPRKTRQFHSMSADETAAFAETWPLHIFQMLFFFVVGLPESPELSDLSPTHKPNIDARAL